MEAAEIRVPDVLHGHGLGRLRVEVPALPVQDLAARDRGGRGRGESRQDDPAADERRDGEPPRPEGPAEGDDEREHDRKQGDAAQQVVGARQQRRRPAGGHDHRHRGEHRLARGDRHRHRDAGGVEGNEDHALHPRVRDRGERQPDVVELEEAAAEAAEQPDRVDDPDAERRMQRQHRGRERRDRPPAWPWQERRRDRERNQPERRRGACVRLPEPQPAPGKQRRGPREEGGGPSHPRPCAALRYRASRGDRLRDG